MLHKACGDQEAAYGKEEIASLQPVGWGEDDEYSSIHIHAVAKYYYNITGQSTCFSNNPVESGCNVVCVRDSRHALRHCSGLTGLRLLCVMPQPITF